MDIADVFGAEIGFNQRFAVYVPDKDRDGKPVKQHEWVVRIQDLLADICGGATAMPPVRGAWLNRASGQLVIEEPVLVYAFVDPKPFAERVEEVALLVRAMGAETNQGQVAFEFDNALYFINF